MPHYRAEILTIFGSYFGRNDDFINSFINLLTFSNDEEDSFYTYLGVTKGIKGTIFVARHYL